MPKCAARQRHCPKYKMLLWFTTKWNQNISMTFPTKWVGIGACSAGKWNRNTGELKSGLVGSDSSPAPFHRTSFLLHFNRASRTHMQLYAKRCSLRAPHVVFHSGVICHAVGLPCWCSSWAILRWLLCVRNKIFTFNSKIKSQVVSVSTIA